MKTLIIPPTTAEDCAKYQARNWKCNCPDRANRGGSYFCERLKERVCKHMSALREGLIDGLAQRAIELNIPEAEMRAAVQRKLDRMPGKNISPKSEPIFQPLQDSASTAALIAQLDADAVNPDSPLAFQTAAQAVNHPNFVPFDQTDDDQAMSEIEMEIEAIQNDQALVDLMADSADDDTPLTQADQEAIKASRRTRRKARQLPQVDPAFKAESTARMDGLSRCRSYSGAAIVQAALVERVIADGLVRRLLDELTPQLKWGAPATRLTA